MDLLVNLASDTILNAFMRRFLWHRDAVVCSLSVRALGIAPSHFDAAVRLLGMEVEPDDVMPRKLLQDLWTSLSEIDLDPEKLRNS